MTALCTGRSISMDHLYLQSDLHSLLQANSSQRGMAVFLLQDSLDWNQQLQPIITDGWEEGQRSSVINPLEMGCTGKTVICSCGTEMQHTQATAHCSSAKQPPCFFDYLHMVSVGPSILWDWATALHLQQLFRAPDDTQVKTAIYPGKWNLRVQGCTDISTGLTPMEVSRSTGGRGFLCPTSSTIKLVYLHTPEKLHGGCQEPPGLDLPSK